MKKITRFFLTFLTLTLAGTASTAWSGTLTDRFSDLFVFGDSIVDTGNTQALVLAAGGGDVAPAAAGYFEGRFTNGINPADVVNQAIEGENLTGSLLGGDNFSFGGARARDDGDFIPDLMLQVQAYLFSVTGVVDPDALHLINVGGNDVRDIVINGADATETIATATGVITEQVRALKKAGAENILFLGVGDVGGIPEVTALGDDAAAVGRQASEDINLAIRSALQPLGVDFFDTLAFFDEITPMLEANGVNTAIPCLISGLSDPLGPPSCDGFAFFDAVHPATASLQLAGNAIVAALVPAPGTLALLALGLIGMGARRRI